MKYSNLSILFIPILLLNNSNAAYVGLKPKMVSEEVTITSSSNLFKATKQTISSSNAVYLGNCSPTQPFEFRIGSKAGRGAVGSLCSVAPSISVTSVNRNVTLEGEPQPQGDFFALGEGTNSGEELCGSSFVIADGGLPSNATVSCTADTPIIIIMRDDLDDKMALTTIEAEVTCGKKGSQGIKLKGDAASMIKANLEGQTRPSTIWGLTMAAAEEMTFPASFQSASSYGITILRNPTGSSDPSVSLIQVTLDDRNGGQVYRTLITEAKTCTFGHGGSRKLKNMVVQSSGINSDGDVELYFDLHSLMEEGRELSEEEDTRFKVQARLGILSRFSNEDKKVHKVVDVSAFLHPDEPKMVVHGGWIRRALASIPNKEVDEWDIVVVEAIVSDPEDGYHILAKLNDVHVTDIGLNDGNEHRHLLELLTQPPTAEEAAINNEMREGRRPDLEGHMGGPRALQSTVHKKILVHGYCGTNPFPLSQFTDAIAFSDPMSGKNNWSNDNFARRIGLFAKNAGIYGCGIIAHSQGGLASLHLKTFYWSCLDSSDRGGSKRMQSVGSPYQGTPLMNIGAYITCGSVYDLSVAGASRWLQKIPNTFRAQMSYYTTSFLDGPGYDYCSQLTDLFLADPEDGAVERTRGQLPSGTNMGHTYGQCHTMGMRDPAQTSNSARNAAMNSNARY